MSENQTSIRGLVCAALFGGLTATATARFTGERLVYNTQTDGAYPARKTVKYTMDYYWTADLKIEQRLFKNWILSLSGTNLFDKQYDTYLQSFTDETTFQSVLCPYPGAGRAIFAGLSYEY